MRTVEKKRRRRIFPITIFACNQSAKCRYCINSPAIDSIQEDLYNCLRLSQDEAIEAGRIRQRSPFGRKAAPLKFLAPHHQKSFDATEFLTCHLPHHITTIVRFAMAVKKSGFNRLADQLADLEDPTPKGPLRSHGGKKVIHIR